MSLDYVDKELPKLLAQHTPALNTESFHERRAALGAAAAAVAQVREHDRSLRQQEDAQAGERTDTATAALERAAEEQRRRCAAELLDAAFNTRNPDSLASLIAGWHIQPSRPLTLAIHARWVDLNTRAEEQLGVDLGHHIIAVCMIDALVPGMSGAPLMYVSEQYYGYHPYVIGALGAFASAADPAAMQNALETLESSLMAAGRRGAGQPDSPTYHQLHALRRVHATHGDLANATSAFNRELERARQARFEAEYIPPSRERPMSIPDAPAADGGGRGLLGRALGYFGSPL